MKTLRVVVTRSHRLSVDRIVEVGEVLDLPENVAIERISTNAVRLVVADSEGSGDVTGGASAPPAAAVAPAESSVADGAQPSEPPAPEPKPTPPAPAKSGRRSAN